MQRNALLITAKFLLIISTLCFFLSLPLIYNEFKDFEVDGLNVGFVMAVNIVSMIVPLGLAIWVYKLVKNQPVDGRSVMFLIVMLLMTFSLLGHVIGTAAPHFDLPILWGWTALQAAVFTFFYLTLIVISKWRAEG